MQNIIFLYDTSILGLRENLEIPIYHLKISIMAKGKCTYQVGKAAGGGRRDYVYAVNKKNLPQGEKLKLMKYDKVTRTHVEYTFVDAK